MLRQRPQQDEESESDRQEPDLQEPESALQKQADKQQNLQHKRQQPPRSKKVVRVEVEVTTQNKPKRGRPCLAKKALNIE